MPHTPSSPENWSDDEARDSYNMMHKAGQISDAKTPFHRFAHCTGAYHLFAMVRSVGMHGFLRVRQTAPAKHRFETSILIDPLVMTCSQYGFGRDVSFWLMLPLWFSALSIGL